MGAFRKFPASPHGRLKTKPPTRGGRAEGLALASGGEESPPVTAAPFESKASDVPDLAGELLSRSATDPSAFAGSERCRLASQNVPCRHAVQRRPTRHADANSAAGPANGPTNARAVRGAVGSPGPSLARTVNHGSVQPCALLTLLPLLPTARPLAPTGARKCEPGSTAPARAKPALRRSAIAWRHARVC